jgi:prepilin-type N-terminal cleavage/methylation domain-containing protein
MMRRRSSRGFTLVELLVVITIIVVLLSLLTPALDRAIYSAELAACGAGMHSMGAGVLAYAFDFQRQYPRRTAYSEPHRLAFSIAPFNGDDRPVLRRAFSLKLLNDPLNGTVDYDSPQASIVFSSYYLWFGFQYNGEKGMRRIGDRFSWTDGTIGGNPIVRRFNLLVSEHDAVDTQDTQVHGNHPDRDGVMQHQVVQDGQVELGFATPPDAIGASGFQWTVARWFNTATEQRGELDMNFLSDDGSVARIDSVRWDEGRLGDRVVRVPHHHDANRWDGQWAHLPRQNF